MKLGACTMIYLHIINIEYNKNHTISSLTKVYIIYTMF